MEILKYFDYEHLPTHLQEVSKQFHTVAYWMNDNLPKGEETSTGLRMLLETKDCAARAALAK